MTGVFLLGLLALSGISCWGSPFSALTCCRGEPAHDGSPAPCCLCLGVVVGRMTTGASLPTQTVGATVMAVPRLDRLERIPAGDAAASPGHGQQGMTPWRTALLQGQGPG